jgi:hypothetical protein
MSIWQILKKRRRDKKYNQKPKVKKQRASLNKNREHFIKKGLVRRGDRKNVGHIKATEDGGSNNPSNLQVESESYNKAKANKGKARTGGRK